MKKIPAEYRHLISFSELSGALIYSECLLITLSFTLGPVIISDNAQFLCDCKDRRKKIYIKYTERTNRKNKSIDD